MALASLADYQVICGPVAESDELRITRLLEMASDAVLGGSHGQLIEAGTSTTTVRAQDGHLWLPQRPVRAVSSVVIDGNELDPTEYRWEPGGNGQAATITRRRGTWWSDVEATVTYEHGWVAIPGPIIATTIAIAAGALDAAGGAVVTSWTAEELGEKLDAKTVQPGDMTLTGNAQATLDRWCGLDASTTAPIVGQGT